MKYLWFVFVNISFGFKNRRPYFISAFEKLCDYMRYFTQSHEFNFKLRRKLNEMCNEQSHDEMVLYSTDDDDDDDDGGLLKCKTKARIGNKSSLSTLQLTMQTKNGTKQFK